MSLSVSSSPSMLHFPSSSFTSPQHLPRRTDSLNATQQRQRVTNGNADHNDKEALLLKIEEDLHDARRVEAHGQEDDLRMALGMVIRRVGELTSLLTDALKSQADLEVQLNVAKSNLKLVISNNEMLEEALRSSSHNPKDVGWRRSAQTPTTIPPSPLPHPASPPPSSPESPRVSISSSTSPYNPTPASSSESRFFKFRFSSSSTNLSHNNNNGATATSPLPQSPYNPHHAHVASSSMSSLHSTTSTSQLEDLEKGLSSLKSQLEKEKTLRQKAVTEKSQLEDELESLSQALFEEANKMVKTERMKRAEMEEELREVKEQRQALQGALKVVEREVVVLRGSGSGLGLEVPGVLDLDGTPRPPPSKVASLTLGGPDGILYSSVMKRARSDSEVGVKSMPSSPTARKEALDSEVGARSMPSSPTGELEEEARDGEQPQNENENEDGDTTMVLERHPSDIAITSPTPSSSSFTVTPGSTPGPASATFPSSTTSTETELPVPSPSAPASTNMFTSRYGEDRDPEPSPWADARSTPYIFSSVSI